MPAKRRVSKVVSLPAPIGGWNVRDPLPMMKPEYAPLLDNAFCLPSEVQIRKGYVKHATFTGTAETLFDYNTKAGVETLYAVVNNAGTCSIYDVSASGAVGAAKVTGLTNARYKFTQFSTSGGTFLYLVNGADSPILHDGTNWYSVTGVSAPYAITGVTTSKFSDVVSHKRRLWFVEKDSLSCWYLPTDSLAGAAVQFDFAPIFKAGGYITKIDTWSLDAGEGLDDYFVIFTSQGEVAVYRGTDPATASTWGLTGVFTIGSPTGTGKTCKYGGDLLIINKDGIAQMSKSLMSSRVNTKLQLTDKIQPQLASDTTAYAANYGWDILLFFPQNMLLVNIPAGNGVYYQYVMNTISGAWSRWTNIPAVSWYMSGEKLWFGADGYTAQAWTGQADDGANVNMELLPAYYNFGSESMLKRWTLSRVIFGSTRQVSYGSRMEIDFNTNLNEVTIPFQFSPTPAAGVYGTGVYGTAVYGDDVISIRRDWKTNTGIGYWGSLHMKFQTKQADVRIYAVDIMVEQGGNI